MVLNTSTPPLSSGLHQLSLAWLSSSLCLNLTCLPYVLPDVLSHLFKTDIILSLFFLKITASSPYLKNQLYHGEGYQKPYVICLLPLFLASLMSLASWSVFFYQSLNLKIPIIYYTLSCLHVIFMSSSLYFKWSSSSLSDHLLDI